MAQDTTDWRHILYRIAYKLISGVCIRTDYKKNDLPTVLIADDSDLPKTGFHIEAIGKVFSLHGEKGKKEGKEQGLTAKQRQVRI